jgi:aldose 1-epimerase
MPRPTGEQFVIAVGDTRATVTEIGATLRTYEAAGRPLLWGFAEDEMSSGGRGQVLAPWPNRLADGTYRFGSRRGQAALDEPDRHNAIHGIVRWLPFVVERIDDAALTCALRLGPQPAYPWWWRLEVTYVLSPGALSVTATFENLDDEPAPFALGFHPYLVAGPEGLDGSTVAVPARRHLVADARMLPIGDEPTSQYAHPAIAERLELGGCVIDDAFCDLERDGNGRWHASFWPDAASDPVEVWGDEIFTHVMCFTGDTLAGSDRRRALAIEPMTAPPNALATGDGVRAVPSGGRVSASWGIGLV